MGSAVKAVVGGVGSALGVKQDKVKIPDAPAPAPEAPEGYKTAEKVETDESIRTRKKRSRNSLRIDTNVAGDSGAGGQGLNIPR